MKFAMCLILLLSQYNATGTEVSPESSTMINNATGARMSPGSTTMISNTTNPGVPPESSTMISNTTNPGVPPESTTTINNTTNPGVPPESTTTINNTTNPGVPPESTTMISNTTNPVVSPESSTMISNTTSAEMSPESSTTINTTNPGVSPKSTTMINNTTNPEVPPKSSTMINNTSSAGMSPESTTMINNTTNPEVPPKSSTMINNTTNPWMSPGSTTTVNTSTVNQNASINWNAIMQENKMQNTDCQNDTNLNGTECSQIAVVGSDDPKGKQNIDYVEYFFVMSFLLMGLVGNSLTIGIMSTKQFRSMSISLVLIVLSVSDTITILLQLHNKLFFRNLIGIDIRAQSVIGCQMFYFSFRTAKMCSSWSVVIICVERFVAVIYPLKAKFICTKRNVIIGMAVIFSALVTFNGARTVAFSVVNGACMLIEPPSMSKMLVTITITVYCFIPSTILVILTPIICFHLYKRVKLQRECGSGHQKTESEMKRTTGMLLGVNIAFVVLVTPISLAHAVSFYYNGNVFKTPNSTIAAVLGASQYLEQLNYCINFFLYVICSKSFRNKIITSCSGKGVKKQATRSTNVTAERTTP